MLSVVGMDPHPNVHLAAYQLAEHHSDCLRSLFGYQPHRVLGVDPSESRADLVVETAGRPAGTITGGTDIGRPGAEEVAVDSLENGRSTRCSPELSGRSISVKVS